MRILGIAAHHRDSAAALVVDGEVVAAAQEERFTRLTLDSAFPRRAIRWCLASRGIPSTSLDRVVFYEKPLRKFERVLVRSLAQFPRSSWTFAKSAFLWLGDRLWIRNRIADDLSIPAERVLFVEQARAQLANAFYSSPFEESALLLLDDVCEWATTVFGRGRGTSVELLHELRHPNSLGLFASAMTQFLGFAPGEEEYKLEALSAEGEPRLASLLGNLVHAEAGAFVLAERAFRFDDGAARLHGPELEHLLGPARHSGEPLRSQAPDAFHADLAASVQHVLEKRTLDLARELARRVPSQNLCLAGLLAQNTRLCTRLVADGPFPFVHVACASGKAGGAVGAALYAHHALDPSRPTRVRPPIALGEAIDERAEEGARELVGEVESRRALVDRLARGERVGWVRGAMEFGVRSLGRRVVLTASAGSDARARLLAALQHVESFLPCRVALPVERAAEFLELGRGLAGLAECSQVVVGARPALRAHAPSAVQADGRVWPLLVRSQADPEFHAVLALLAEKTGRPLALMSDFAMRGSPIVRNEVEAVEAFRRSALDALVAGTRVYARP
jgi:carbamoyltransferase